MEVKDNISEKKNNDAKEEKKEMKKLLTYCYKTKFVALYKCHKHQNAQVHHESILHSTRIVFWHRLDMDCIKNYL